MTKGERIKRKRELLRISQTELANRIGVSKQTLYKYENNIVTNIPSDVIEKISQNLNCTPAYIMGWDDSDIISEYTKKFSSLTKEDQNTVMQYIDFLSRKEK